MDCKTAQNSPRPGVRDDARQGPDHAGTDRSVTDPDVQAALARISVAITRALLRIQANEARGAAVAQHPRGSTVDTPSS
jgi:hypothetical protein